MENQHGPKQPANLKVTRQALDALQYSTDVFDLPAVQDNWMRTYQKTTGRTDGPLRFEAEKVMMLQAVKASPQLQKATKESLYGVFIELALSGLSLRDGMSYIIPYGDKATFLIGWKGRLEQINHMPTVVHVQEPQVVYDCDKFVYERGMEVKVISHQPQFPRPEGAQIHFVYFVIHFTFGTKCFIMDRDEVLAIRDNHSDSYKQYLIDLPNVVNGKITKQGRNGSYTKDFEPPMWVTNEAQAFRKTIVKRVYNNMEKLPHQKNFDEHLATKYEQPEDVDEMANQYDYKAAMAVEDDGTYTPAEVVEDPPAQQQEQPAAQNVAQPQQQPQQQAQPAQQAQQAQPTQQGPKTGGGRAQVNPTVQQPQQQAAPAQQVQPQNQSQSDPEVVSQAIDNALEQTGLTDLFGNNTPPPPPPPDDDLGNLDESF